MAGSARGGTSPCLLRDSEAEVEERMPYATDLSDEQWALIELLITAWKQERVARSATGDPGSCGARS